MAISELPLRLTRGVYPAPSGWSSNRLMPNGISDLGEGGDFHSALVEVERVR